MKRVHLFIALGALTGLFALWALCPRTRIGEAPRDSQARRRFAPEAPAPPVAVASMPLPVRPEEKLPESSSPLPPDPKPILAERHARMGAALGAPGPWEYLKGIPSGLGDMGREAAIRKTADYLSIEAGSRTAFLAAARQSVKDMDEARALRSREVSALGVVSPSVGDEFRRSTERYAAAREGALGRLEPYLGQTPACQDFRQGFDSWAGLVAGKAQGHNR